MYSRENSDGECRTGWKPALSMNLKYYVLTLFVICDTYYVMSLVSTYEAIMF